MKKTRSEENGTEVVEDILCNKCGRSCEVHWDEVPLGFNCAELRAHWGYFSQKDWETHTAHLCELCWDEVTATFVLPVTVVNELDHMAEGLAQKE